MSLLGKIANCKKQSLPVVPILTYTNFLSFPFRSPIPRDILENGGGKGTAGAATALSRSPAILAMRIKYNSYPIYLVEGDRMR